MKADNFIDYVSQPALLQDVAYGTRKLKLDSGETILMPDVIGTVIPSRIVQQYKIFCETINFSPLSDSTLFKILNVCGASQQKSMEGLDYIATDGVVAFEGLEEIVDTLVNTGNADSEWQRKIKEQLKSSKRYLKIDYKTHITPTDKCPDHCIQYALSDEKQQTSFASACDHEHDVFCDRCTCLHDTLQEIEDKIQNSELPDAQKSRLTHEFTLLDGDIVAWKCHLLRAINQELAKQDVLSDLNEDGALIIMDWATRFMPMRTREKMTDFYGKRGMDWHVSAVITKKEGNTDFSVDCYVHLFDSCTQNWFSVASIIENLLHNIKKKNNRIQRVYFRSDNAGCYHNAALLLSLPGIGNRTGFQICRYDFSDVQAGKDICDRKISPMKTHMKTWVNEKNDITTAEQMKI